MPKETCFPCFGLRFGTFLTLLHFGVLGRCLFARLKTDLVIMEYRHRGLLNAYIGLLGSRLFSITQLIIVRDLLNVTFIFN